jgi:uncharacterized damage-inducible protein DinB
MNAQDAQVVSEFLLATLESEIPITVGVFRAVPVDRLDYRPDAMSKSALGLLRHITLEDEWILNAVADGAFTPPPDDSDACGVMTPEDAVARYKARIPAAIARVRALSGEALLKEVDLMGAFQMPAVQFLSMTVRHSAHHRGQLSAYLRAMGGKVPSIYGPSADTTPASASAEAVTV